MITISFSFTEEQIKTICSELAYSNEEQAEQLFNLLKTDKKALARFTTMLNDYPYCDIMLDGPRDLLCDFVAEYLP